LVTPVEQLIRVSQELGLNPVEKRVGTTGARKIFEFSRPMPNAVRELGCRLEGLSYHYWQAGEEGLKEGFGDLERLEDIEFPAALVSVRRLKFHLRRIMFDWNSWRSDRLEAKLARTWRKPGSPKVLLNADLIGPATDEYERIEAASSVVSEKITKVVAQRHLRLWWSYGDSDGWRVIIGIPTESQFAEFTTHDLDSFATELSGLIGSVVEFTEKFQLYVELDTDERVEANEGWFFRIKSDPQPRREFVFDQSGKRLSQS